jgi:HD-like signal output (HDOD) protein
MTSATSALEIIGRAKRIASPPVVYEKLMGVIENPGGGLADVARVLQEDPGLTTRLLRVVNSAFYSFPRRIETVDQAVRVVGTSQIRELVLATSVISLFNGIDAAHVNMESFWEHSLATGVAARVMAGYQRQPNVERFFVVGLLHDIGRLILFSEAGDDSQRALERSQELREPLRASERAIWGCDHAQIGGALLSKWNFPASHQEAVTHHHAPELARRFPVETAIVHVGDILAHALGYGSSGERWVPAVSLTAWETLGIDPALLPGLAEDIEKQFQAARALLDAAKR